MNGRISSGLIALALGAAIGRPAQADVGVPRPVLGYAALALPTDLTVSWTPGSAHPKLKKPATAVPARIPNMVAGTDADCLTAAIYYEARSEPVEGQRAVAAVVMNRVNRPSFARSVCGVVNQRVNGTCQFSFLCDHSTDARRDERAWEAAARIAREALSGLLTTSVGAATFYHTVSVAPGWTARVSRVATIGRHIFYRTAG